ncbi:MAG TPA: DUF6504 family protein [Actinomycetales bacterium]|nr:DUF6504 family protein [Actinomycetales bacterium]
MVRRYDDTIDVRMQEASAGECQDARSPSSAPAASQPAAFVWRDRLYVVQAVQTRWYERRAWWREAAAAALLGLRGDEPRAGAEHTGRTAAAASSRSTGVLDTASYLDGETEVWRVEASAGRSFPVGVFDLARPVSSTGAAAGGWRLTRIAD